ncbi:hypothetical protein ACJIZ3_023752 [Penstemon smallii]|uniref:Uncharacterized protein n=1 Tax=Penstemon smallii TaxID=265156 RepID=A0ABD3TRD8_9LAMI
MKGIIILRATEMLLCSRTHQMMPRRWMVGKAANRAAEEEVKMEITRAIKDKERKRMEIENSVDSHLKNWNVLYVEDMVCSK